MATIYKEIIIEAASQVVWAAVRDVGAVHEKLTPKVLTDARLSGNERILTFATGAVVHELIISIDDERQRLAYAVISGSAHTTFHHATMEVFAHGEGSSRLVWVTDFLPNSQLEIITIIINRGAQIMKSTLEASRISS